MTSCVGHDIRGDRFGWPLGLIPGEHPTDTWYLQPAELFKQFSNCIAGEFQIWHDIINRLILLCLGCRSNEVVYFTVALPSGILYPLEPKDIA